MVNNIRPHIFYTSSHELVFKDILLPKDKLHFKNPATSILKLIFSQNEITSYKFLAILGSILIEYDPTTLEPLKTVNIEYSSVSYIEGHTNTSNSVSSSSKQVRAKGF